MIIIIYRLSSSSSASVLFFLLCFLSLSCAPRACIWKGNQRDMTGGGAQSAKLARARVVLAVRDVHKICERMPCFYIHTHTHKQDEQIGSSRKEREREREKERKREILSGGA